MSWTIEQAQGFCNNEGLNQPVKSKISEGVYTSPTSFIPDKSLINPSSVSYSFYSEGGKVYLLALHLHLVQEDSYDSGVQIVKDFLLKSSGINETIDITKEGTYEIQGYKLTVECRDQANLLLLSSIEDFQKGVDLRDKHLSN